MDTSKKSVSFGADTVDHVAKPKGSTVLRKTMRQMTMRRKAAKQEKLIVLALDLAQWLNETLGLTPEPEIVGLPREVLCEEFFDLIDNGVHLCQLLNKIKPELNIKFKAEAKRNSFVARDNVANFLAGAKALGVPSVCLFEVDDLVAKKNTELVANALLKVAEIGARAGIKPPMVVQYNMEIEEAEKEAKEAQAAGEAEEEEEEVASPVPEAASAPAESASEAAPETASETAPVEVKGEDLPAYIPEEGDEIDAAVAEVVNDHDWDIVIKKVAVKNKKRARQAKHTKGEYKVGNSHKVFVRVVQETVMCRAQGEWVPFEQYVEDLIKKNAL